MHTEPFLCLTLFSFSCILAFAILSFAVSCDLSYSETITSTFKIIVVVRLAIMQPRSGRVYLVMLLCLTSCDSPERRDDLLPHYEKMGDLSLHLKFQALTTFAGTDRWYHGRCQPFPPSITPNLLPLPCLRAHSPTINTKHNIDTHLRFQHTGIQLDFNIDVRIQRTNSKPNRNRNLRLQQRIQMLHYLPLHPPHPHTPTAQQPSSNSLTPLCATSTVAAPPQKNPTFQSKRHTARAGLLLI